jgi:hypothetical protein
MSVSTGIYTAVPVQAAHSQNTRLALLTTLLAAVVLTAFLAWNPQASALAAQHDGAAMTRLMRFMAGLKALRAAAAVAAVLWRLGVAASAGWFGAYALGCAAMAAGPVLIWGLVHVGLGALLLHGGLLAVILLLWRDPAVAQLLEGVLTRRVTAAR